MSEYEYKEDEKLSEAWRCYENAIAYQGKIKLRENLPKFVDFYEGRQWAAPTELTKNLPRPVINIIKMICRAKKSAILSTPVRLVYESARYIDEAARFTRFSDYILKEIRQDELDKQAIEDAVKKGAYAYHYYWDKDVGGNMGIKEGGVRCEVIDPLNIFFSNPCEQDEQKQAWIIIASRESVNSVRAMADKDADTDAIRGDEIDRNDYKRVEQEGDELCTVLTKYFRQDGEVYCEKSVKSTIVNKAFPISPDIEGEMRALNGDVANTSLPDSENRDEDLNPMRGKATLYPIVVGQYERRQDSIYGLGEVEGLIPNQKAINFNIAMALLNCQENAWGKYIVHPQALRSQTITNEPGQVLIDYSNTNNGIHKMTEHSLSAFPVDLVDRITSMVRMVTGSTEVMTGEVLGANMSGAAIAQLQAQAQQPIEELRNAFWDVKEKQGRVLAQFYKLFYANKEYTYKTEAADSNDTAKVNTDVFNGEEYMDIDFEVIVEAVAGTRSSTASDINMLDQLLNKGLIDARTYINSYPQDAITNKNELIKGVMSAENNIVQNLTKQVAEYEERLKAASDTIREQQQTVEQVELLISENAKLRELLIKIYNEATAKIEIGNQALVNMAAQRNTAVNDAAILANGIKRRQTEASVDTQGTAQKSKGETLNGR